MLPRVVIAGRANIGKSTLFNRLIGRRASIVADFSGVTRDHQEAEAQIRGRTVVFVDTAGLDDAAPETLAGRMHAGASRALDQADLVLFLIDARVGLTSADRHFARWLRRQGKPILLVANKVEGRTGHALLETFELGLGEPLAISAEHGDGISALMTEVADRLPPSRDLLESSSPLRPTKLAIVGRPNSGKSTLLNALLGQERMITGPEAGLTRDAIAVSFADALGNLFEIIDTPGLRRRNRIDQPVEKMSVYATIGTLKRADVALICVDAAIGLEDQDLQIARLIEREGRAAILLFTKWDAIRNIAEARRVRSQRIKASLSQLRGITEMEISAHTSEGLNYLFPEVCKAEAIWNSRISTSQLNRWFEGATMHHQPPLLGSRRLKLRYITQATTRPPTFIIFGNRATEVPEDYRRYLVNSLRDELALPGTPIRLLFRSTVNPYADQRPS